MEIKSIIDFFHWYKNQSLIFFRNRRRSAQTPRLKPLDAPLGHRTRPARALDPPEPPGPRLRLRGSVQLSFTALAASEASEVQRPSATGSTVGVRGFWTRWRCVHGLRLSIRGVDSAGCSLLSTALRWCRRGGKRASLLVSTETSRCSRWSYRRLVCPWRAKNTTFVDVAERERGCPLSRRTSSSSGAPRARPARRGGVSAPLGAPR